MNIQVCFLKSISLIVITLLIMSCEKEIDIRLDGVPPKYVIEGVVADEEGNTGVWISQTKDFAEDNSRRGVSGAIVEISDGEQTYLLAEQGNGYYTHQTLISNPGTTYQLAVQLDGKHYTASSTVPDVVSMDSLFIREELLFGEQTFLPAITYTDPANERNYYRFVLYANDIKKRDIFVFDDDMTNGNEQSINLFYMGEDEDDDDPRNDKIKRGDRVRVQMLCIDAAVYKYFYSLASSATGDPNGAAPANPVTNLQGGALGYFSAHTVQQQEVVVP